MGKNYRKRNEQRGRNCPYKRDVRKKKDKYMKHYEQRPKSEPKINLKEDQVGITEYVTDGKSFSGVVKARYSDFQVNEIDLNGKVLQLDNLDIPQLDSTISEGELEAIKLELKDVLTPEVLTKIESFSKMKDVDLEAAAEDFELEINLDKEKRTKLHKILKKMYFGKLVSSTINSEKGDTKVIKICRAQKGRAENRIQWTFPGEYIHFLVHKENMETSEVASIMASRIRLPASKINYCGTKDKRAKTTQKFCIKKRTPSQIFGSIKGVANVHIGNFEFSQETLKLGQLKGNRFRIALRHVKGENAEIEATLQQIKERGFINYYGLQRFGNCASIPTYEIGIALLKSDYKSACELIMKPRENDIPFMHAVRQTWWKERNSAAAAAMIHDDKFIEKKLLSGLAQYGEHDYAAALRKISRNVLLLYPHAFQSLIFNRIASRRIKEFGLQLIPGDLVLCNKDETDFAELVEIMNCDEDETDEQMSLQSKEDTISSKIVDEDKEEVLLQSNSTEDTLEDAAERKLTVEEKHNEDSDKVIICKQKVKPLTAEDIASGEWTLFDVVLPLPGYDISLPENEVGKWYMELLQEYDLSMAKLKHAVKLYSMAGAYRRLLIKPDKMNWQFTTYNNVEDTLIASDWEMLRKKDVVSNAGAEGKFKAVILDFCLPTAAYATMLLRELLKEDTSAANQTELERNEMEKHIENVALEMNTSSSTETNGQESEEQNKQDERNKQDKRNDGESVAKKIRTNVFATELNDGN